MSSHVKRLEAALRVRRARYDKGDVIDSYYERDSHGKIILYELRESDLRALLAENERLRIQNDELFTENHEMQHGPTVSAED